MRERLRATWEAVLRVFAWFVPLAGDGLCDAIREEADEWTD